MKSLETLYIDLNPIGDKGVAALAQNNSIKELSVAGCSIGSEGAIALSSMANLEELNLNFNHIDERGSAALAKMKLDDLDLAGNWLYDEGTVVFADAKIDTLDLEYNRIENAGAKALARNKGISYLDVQHNWIGQKGIDALKNSGIEQVYTDGNVSYEERDDLKKQKSHHAHSKHRLVLDMFDKGGKKHHRVS